MSSRTAVLCLCLGSAALAQNPPSKLRADIIFVHGNVYTGVAGGATFGEAERAQAIAVRGERILAIGPERDVLQLKGPETKIVDLGGRFVMPGFNDAHLHLADAGLQRRNVDLTGVKSLAEFRDRIRARAEAAAPGEWIRGGGWDQTLWPVKELPSRWDVDEVTADHPVFLDRVDGHIAVVNTRALQLASITIATRDPAGGRIDRDLTDQPTGILRETARAAVWAVIPKPNHDQRKQALEMALHELAKWGITSAQDNSEAHDSQASWEDFQVLEELEKEGKLTARVSEWLYFDDPLDVLQSRRAAHSAADSMLRTGQLKAFLDGSLGSRTAAMLDPYTDDPKNSGLPQYDQGALNQMMEERVAAGFQVGFHAIGDKGVQMALFAIADAERQAQTLKVKAANGGTDFRFRIEHEQVTTPSQIAKFKQLKVVASIQPCHLLTDMNWAQARLGPQRAARSYAWNDLLQRGVVLAFGTDFPVEPVNPFRGLYAAVTRKSADGKRDYFPGQKLTIDQAIAAYTTGSAFAEFAEKDKGKLVPGMLADFAVLDRDITAVPADKLLATRVLRTVVGGKTVFEAK